MSENIRRSGLGGLLDRLYLLAGYLAGVFLIIVFVLMMVLSVGRNPWLPINIPSGDDFAAWSMAAMSFLALAHTFKHGEMIRVGLLVDQLTGRPRWWIEVVSLAIGLAFTTYFTWFAGNLVLFSYRLNDMSQGIVPIPLWIPQLSFVFGVGLLAIAFLDELIRVLRGELPTYHRDPPATAEEAVERAASSAV